MPNAPKAYDSPHWTVIRQRASMAGVVSDAISGEPIAGAMVEILSGPRMGAQTSRGDGSYVFIGLPAGTYNLRASFTRMGDRYGMSNVATVKISNTQDNQGSWAASLQQLPLPPTRIHGTVQGKQSDGTTAPVAGVKVSLRGSSDSTVTDGDGRYALNAIQAGSRTVEIMAAGYRPAVVTAALAAGQDYLLDLTLDPDTPSKQANGVI